MRLASLLGPDLSDTLASEPEALVEALDEFHPEDVAEILDDLELDDAVALMKVLPDDFAADVMERLDTDRQVEILNGLGVRESIPVVAEMAPDDRVDLVQDLPDALAEDLLQYLEAEDPEAAEETRELGQHDEETAGGIMTPEVVALRPETKVWKAIDEVRRLSHEENVETISYVYVTAYGGQLVGVLSLRDLILADPSQTLSDVMTEHVVRVEIDADQEHVARTIAKYDINAVPVVDEHGILRGVVTVDDVVDVMVEEATEDAQMMGGVVPLEESYFQTGLVEFVWKRAVWLVILFGGQLLTATVMEQHEATMATLAGLVVFIPLIIATGGNSGAQSSTLVIRALAVGEMRPSDWLRVLGRESGIGIAIGLVLGGVGFARAWFVGDDASLHLAITVTLSITAVTTLGTTMGSLLPLLIRRLGFDPAVSSTPFIASLVDVLGLVIYFAIAQSVFTMVF
jgi:magnesium transporter